MKTNKENTVVKMVIAAVFTVLATGCNVSDPAYRTGDGCYEQLQEQKAANVECEQSEGEILDALEASEIERVRLQTVVETVESVDTIETVEVVKPAQPVEQEPVDCSTTVMALEITQAQKEGAIDRARELADALRMIPGVLENMKPMCEAGELSETVCAQVGM